MTTVNIKYETLKGLSQQQLLALLEKATIEAVDTIADLLVELIQQRVNVDTGTMRGSIRKETIGKTVSVIMGGDQYINPKTGKPCDYAPFQEAVNPTFEPALKMVEADLVTLITARINQKLAEAGVTVE